MAAAAALPSPRSEMPPPPPPPPVPPSTARRPRRRAREVSSRYLSTPVPSTPRLSTASATSSSSSTSRATSPSPRARTQRTGTPFANENHPPPPTGTTVARRRAVQRLFDERSSSPRASVSSAAPSAFSAAAPTPRPLPRSCSGPAASTARRGYPRLPTPARAGSCPSAAAAAAADDASSCSSFDTASTGTDFSEAEVLGVATAAPCESPPLLGPASCRGGRLSSELRASVPESCGSVRASNPLCYRSLNSALSISTATMAKATGARPPQPQGMKATELKKATILGARKAAGKLEDVHQLRLMENRYLQYRFLNARAEAAAKAKTASAEKSLYGLTERITSLRELVSEKSVEVEKIKREQRLSSVVSAQLRFLDKWSEIEADHSSCLRGATTALHNASLRLPIIGNIRADCGEIEEVLKSAAQLLQPLHVENFLTKVNKIDDAASNLAQVIASERTLIEECGNLLYQAENLQARVKPKEPIDATEECSIEL
ncbi:hypothetical protein ACP4OV_030596 [Aristida adscensionis]